MTSEIAIIRTGTANLASVRVALERLGANPRVITTAEEVLSAARLVLPGVGSFGSASSELARSDLAAPIVDRIEAGTPLLAICLGFQLLAAGSDESPASAGLGVIPGRVQKLEGSERTPHIGWNLVSPQGNTGVFDQGHAYYANSFALTSPVEGWECATTTHGTEFVAGITRGPQLACQFHPELSGRWGHELLRRWWCTC